MSLPGSAFQALHNQRNSSIPAEPPCRDRGLEIEDMACGRRTAHYNDWPNTIGFDIHEEQREPVELAVTGRIPDYCRGVLFRVGPGGNRIQPNDRSSQSLEISHWFDGLGQMHRFSIESPTKVIYTSRFTCDSLVEKIRKSGKLSTMGFTFGQKRDPCQSYFRKFVSVFASRADLRTRGPSSVNTNVTVSYNMPGIPTPNLVSKTDANVLQSLDPETLEPKGVVNQTILHPSLNGPLSAAHSRTCPRTGDMFNYNLTLGPVIIYRIFRVCGTTGKTTILATIKDAPASYIHSFFLTETHVILCCFSAHYSFMGTKLLYVKNILESLSPFDPSEPSHAAVWYLIPRNRSPQSTVTRLTSPGFFSFHCSNAYNVNPSDPNSDIIAECITYSSIEILSKFFLSHLRGDSSAAMDWIDRGRGVLTRFRLSPRTHTVERIYEAPIDLASELPIINPSFTGRKHRYTYALVNRCKSTLLDGIIKFDAEGEEKVWECHGHTPGEAVFVPDPEGTEEDDGMLLSVVLDGKRERSYLLVLDARTLKEVARAEVNGVVAMGFHGSFVGVDGTMTET